MALGEKKLIVSQGHKFSYAGDWVMTICSRDVTSGYYKGTKPQVQYHHEERVKNPPPLPIEQLRSMCSWDLLIPLQIPVLINGTPSTHHFLYFPSHTTFSSTKVFGFSNELLQSKRHWTARCVAASDESLEFILSW